MKMCFDINGEEFCIPVPVERRWPPIPPEDPFDFRGLIVEDPSWWRTVITVDTIDHMAREVGGDFGAQLHQAAVVGLESLQTQLPEGVSLNLSTRLATTA